LAKAKLAFEPYTTHQPDCSVVAVTPEDRACLHTYYDVQPFSPSGRLLVCLGLPFEDHRPAPQDEAQVCVVDLVEKTLEPVCATGAWGFQTGAHQMWGRDDATLYFNVRVNGRPVGSRLDLQTGRTTLFEGPLWVVAPDESYAISPCLIRANLTQPEYGVAVHPEDQIENHQRASDKDGLFRVDLQTGGQTLLISLAEVWEVIPDREDLDDAVLYGFHAKINGSGSRIMFVVRARMPSGEYRPMLLTCRPDGSELRVTVPHRVWARGGHHPIWHPDGEHILMNLVPQGDTMRFCLVSPDGAIRPLLDNVPGSGHPIVSPDRRRMVTDLTDDSGNRRMITVRLFDLVQRSWADICRAESPLTKGAAVPMRRDGHITWDRGGRRMLFLAAPKGSRQLFVIDPDLDRGEIPSF
jgi:hypothetical protein